VVFRGAWRPGASSRCDDDTGVPAWPPELPGRLPSTVARRAPCEDAAIREIAVPTDDPASRRAGSSVGQSSGLIIRQTQVRVLPGPLRDRRSTWRSRPFRVWLRAQGVPTVSRNIGVRGAYDARSPIIPRRFPLKEDFPRADTLGVDKYQRSRLKCLTEHGIRRRTLRSPCSSLKPRDGSLPRKAVAIRGASWFAPAALAAAECSRSGRPPRARRTSATSSAAQSRVARTREEPRWTPTALRS
jgi:hypothetical protein